MTIRINKTSLIQKLMQIFRGRADSAGMKAIIKKVDPYSHIEIRNDEIAKWIENIGNASDLSDEEAHEKLTQLADSLNAIDDENISKEIK